jgi:hypothetical protein
VEESWHSRNFNLLMNRRDRSRKPTALVWWSRYSLSTNPLEVAMKNTKVMVASLFAAILLQQTNRAQAQTVLDNFWVTDGWVHTIVKAGNVIYIGGSFGRVGPVGGPFQTRNNIAAIDATTGEATSWNPSANAVVEAIAVSGSTVYVAGEFTTIAGVARNNIAALDNSTGQAKPWNPNPDYLVRSLAVSGSSLYVGGKFRSIAGQVRYGIARFDADTGNLLDWGPRILEQEPDFPGMVWAICPSGNIVYVAGEFQKIVYRQYGQLGLLITASRSNIAALYTDGRVTSWNPSANDRVLELSVYGNLVYAAGDFENIGGEPRRFVASIEAATGKVTTWNPNPNFRVNAITILWPVLYAGGDFTSIGGQPRNNIAALDAITGELRSWSPTLTGRVFDLASEEATLYLGGNFIDIQYSGHSYFAAVSTGYALSVSAVNGTVARNPDQPMYAEGMRVQLTATPIVGYHFVDWSGDAAGTANPISIMMDGDKSITASFALTPPEITPGIAQMGPQENVTFSVVSDAPPLSYEWWWQPPGSPAFVLSGATGASYTAPGPLYEQAMWYENWLKTLPFYYWCVVTYPDGTVKRTNKAVLTGQQWRLATNGSATLTTVPYNSEAAKVSTISPGPDFQLYLAHHTLEPNTRYRLSFDAYSNTGHNMSVFLDRQDAPYTNYGLNDFVVNLTTSWQTFSTEFTTRGFCGTVDNGRLRFWLAPYATAGDEHYIGHVMLEKVVPINILENSGFESGKDSWSFFKIGPGSFDVVSPGFEGSYAAKISTARAASYVQLSQLDLAFERDANYRLSFAAYSTTGHDMTVLLQSGFGLKTYKANLSPSWQTYSTEFKTTGFWSTGDNGRLIFVLFPYGRSGDVYYIDNVVLQKLDGSSQTAARMTEPLEEQSVAEENLVPEEFSLAQNYPNPFNPTTTIRYALPVASHVTLKVYNTLGQEVEALVDESQDAGFKSVIFDAGRLASGIYFYRIQAGNFVDTKKLLILK